MNGSQGVSGLSRSAGDESLKRTQRVNEDGHDEKDKDGRDRKRFDNDNERQKDSYESAAGAVGEQSPEQSAERSAIPSRPDTPASHLTKTESPHQTTIPAAPEKIDSTTKDQKKPGATESKTQADTDHIDLVG